jgi:hypothetical protein
MNDPVITYLTRHSRLPETAVISALMLGQETMCSKQPELEGLFTRAYRIPPTHMSWSRYQAMMIHGTVLIDTAIHFCEVFAPTALPGLIEILQSQATHSNISQMARKYAFPFWLVGSELCELLARTDSLADPNIDMEAPLPFKALHFLVPRGSVPLPDGDSLMMVGVADLTVADVRAHGFDVPANIEEGGRRFYVAGHTWGGHCYYSRLPVSVDGVVADPSTQEFTLYDAQGKVSNDTTGKEEGIRCADVITGWALRFLIVMNCEPELIEPETKTGERKAKRDKRPMTFLDPRWLGRRVINGKPTHSNGTHASPHTHWRRGHNARRRCGKGREQTRVVWIKPVLVNGPREREEVAV